MSMANVEVSVSSRFQEKYEPVPEAGCWLWTASTDTGGYGHMNVAGKLRKASRLSWEIHVGQIPDGAHVLHKCDTRSCVNPDHLFLGTHAVNMADRSAKGRCADVRGARHPQAKLSEADVIAIRADTRLHREIASSYGVTEPSIYKIKHRRSWRHLQ